MNHIRAGTLPIESVELSRTVGVWGLNIFLAFRAGMTEWFWRLEEWEMQRPGVGAIEPGMTFRSAFARENRWRTQIRSHLSEGSRSTIR
jgi:hypothetical protein